MLVGDGSGVAILRKRCAEYGLVDTLNVIGHVPYDDLPTTLHAFDICLSTQTNDVIGNVRTTGKLPLYLAAGRFVLASHVGEAARVLPTEMLVPFNGSIDADYPQRLADRVLELVANRTDFTHRPESVALARTHFEYDLLAVRVGRVIDEVLGAGLRGTA